MSPPIREDFAHGRLFCFVLDMEKESDPSVEGEISRPGLTTEVSGRGDDDDYVSTSQVMRIVGEEDDASVFGNREDDEERDGSVVIEDRDDELRSEAYGAFMRLQLVRQKVVSLNNAMIAMRDARGELSSMFDCIDVRTDTVSDGKLDRKKVKEFQGSIFTPVTQNGKQAIVLPRSIAELNLKTMENAIGRITDTYNPLEGKALFQSLLSRLTAARWLRHKVVRKYNRDIESDSTFVAGLKEFTRALDSSTSRSVPVGKLLVFKYPLEKLITREAPDLFLGSMLHRHMPVIKSHITKALRCINDRGRTRDIASLLKKARCGCTSHRSPSRGIAGTCHGECQNAYACFYNTSERHPFLVSRDDYIHYFAHLYPHLGKLERLSKEMKTKYKGCAQFESMAEIVLLSILAKHVSADCESLYADLSELAGEKMLNSSLSLGSSLSDIHKDLYLTPCPAGSGYADNPRSLDAIKVYDHALVRYLFSDSLQVGRLFQASTTFNYIISNTAPRYTIERTMLFNITGPGEGKSYANNVLNYQFRRVKGCIETLTSFTPQAFKYNQQRNSCVVMIDDAHITHEKSIKASDKESNVIPNTFKNLLDTSVLESDVVSRDLVNGRVTTSRCRAVHNCGFVWNTNTLDFVSNAWADRCVILESEYPAHVSRTRSSKQLQDTVEKLKMDRVTAVCLYRQNLVQATTMISEPEIMQFDRRFDLARDACVAALRATHIMCTGVVSGTARQRVPFCINQLVFAEAMKLACHFVFDIWVPPWTEAPDLRHFQDIGSFMARLNRNRLKALDKLSFGQICLETNAVYKLCAAACLPDICPRVIDMQGRFACKALGYVLTQIHRQGLKTALKEKSLCVSGLDAICFSESQFKGGNDAGHEMLQLCATCEVPGRARSRYKLCTYRVAASQNAPHGRRGCSRPKRVGAVTVPLEAVYDMLAIYAPESHAGFWDQLTEAMAQAYERGDVEEVNAFGHCTAAPADESPEDGGEGRDSEEAGCRVTFSLDFTQDPVHRPPVLRMWALEGEGGRRTPGMP